MCYVSHTSESWSEIRSPGQLRVENEAIHSGQQALLSFFNQSCSNLSLGILGYKNILPDFSPEAVTVRDCSVTYEDTGQPFFLSFWYIKPQSTQSFHASRFQSIPTYHATFKI